jgi:hypothetical protein
MAVHVHGAKREMSVLSKPAFRGRTDFVVGRIQYRPTIDFFSNVK